MELSTSNTNSEKELFQSLSQSYSEILPPNKETLLLIVWLYKKVKSFLQIEKDKNIELLSQKISNHFYQTERVAIEYKTTKNNIRVFAGIKTKNNQ